MALEHYDSLPFRKFTSRSEMDRAMHVLEGLVKGIAIDGIINTAEIEEIQNWYQLNQHLFQKHPFNEIVQLLDDALVDGVFTEEERADILWVCNNYSTGSIYYDLLTSDIQRLHGILHGIIADNRIDLKEIQELDNWLADNTHLESIYPYDEVCTLVHKVLKDGIISRDERDLLTVFFSDFIDIRMSSNLNANELNELRQNINISGLCAICPQIVIPGNLFCFTGKSSKTNRKDIADMIISLGGNYHDNIIKETTYLVVGDNGNPCWAFSCYGRKVEKAVNMRKNGHSILIIHEIDFWDEVKAI